MGLTQAQVARAVGRPQSFVSKCESGERRIDAVELLEFADIYDRSVGYFVAEGEGRSGAMITSDRPSAMPTASDNPSRARRRKVLKKRR